MSSTEKVNLDIHQDASDETVGYQPKGYEFIDEKFIICPACNKKLVSLVLVKKNNSPEQVFQANHLKCGVKSFKVKILGYKVIGQVVPPYQMVDVETIGGLDTAETYTEFIIK